MLDAIHKDKIDLSNAIFVINKDGYIGSSTTSEINYALNKNKQILFYEERNYKVKDFKEGLNQTSNFNAYIDKILKSKENKND